MAKKILIYLLFVPLCTIIAGIYGILHDQISYTIEPEYYILFKFIQFQPVHHLLVTGIHPRVAVGLVGVLATWWVGLIGGIVLGLFGFIHAGYRQMFRFSFQALLLALAIAFVMGWLGSLYGYIMYFANGVEFFSNWYLPAKLTDPENFIIVGSMHNFSYLGGALGLIAGIWWQFRQKKKYGSITLPGV